MFSYKFQAIRGGPVVDRVNNVNFPLKFKARGQIGLRTGGFSINTFYNYANAYRVVGVVPNNQLSPAPVAPAAQNEAIASNFTVDATVTYSFPSESFDHAGSQPVGLGAEPVQPRTRRSPGWPTARSSIRPMPACWAGWSRSSCARSSERFSLINGDSPHLSDAVHQTGSPT